MVQGPWRLRASLHMLIADALAGFLHFVHREGSVLYVRIIVGLSPRRYSVDHVIMIIGGINMYCTKYFSGPAQSGSVRCVVQCNTSELAEPCWHSLNMAASDVNSEVADIMDVPSDVRLCWRHGVRNTSQTIQRILPQPCVAWYTQRR